MFIKGNKSCLFKFPDNTGLFNPRRDDYRLSPIRWNSISYSSAVPSPSIRSSSVFMPVSRRITPHAHQSVPARMSAGNREEVICLGGNVRMDNYKLFAVIRNGKAQAPQNFISFHKRFFQMIKEQRAAAGAAARPERWFFLCGFDTVYLDLGQRREHSSLKLDHAIVAAALLARGYRYGRSVLKTSRYAAGYICRPSLENSAF